MTNNDTIDSQGDFEDEDDDDVSGAGNQKTMRLSTTGSTVMSTGPDSDINSQRDNKEPVSASLGGTKTASDRSNLVQESKIRTQKCIERLATCIKGLFKGGQKS